MPGPDTPEAGPARGRLTKALALVPVVAASVCATHYTAHMTSPVTRSLGNVLHVAADVPLTTAPHPPVPPATPGTTPKAAAPKTKPVRVKPLIDTSLTPFGIPTVAVAAFRNAADVIDGVDPGCQLSWQYLAAIGREESGDGLGDGNVLTTAGIDEPGIYGPVLNGRKGVAAIADSDGGRLDGNTTWDRAVGPMQFLPSTWAVVGVDADGDGVADPQDINDAALSAAVYLCAYGADLGTPAGERAGAFRYNHSHPYVKSVMAILRQYQAGDYTTVATADEKPVKTSKARRHRATSSRSGSATPSAPASSDTASSGTPSSTPTSGPSSQPTSSASPSSGPSSSSSPTTTASPTTSATPSSNPSGSPVSPATSASQSAALLQCLATPVLGADVEQAVPGAATMDYTDLLTDLTGVDTVLAGEVQACVTAPQAP